MSTLCRHKEESAVFGYVRTNYIHSIPDVIKSVNERMPQAVVAVDEDGAFEGYFSPDDYRQAQSILSSNPSLGSL